MPSRTSSYARLSLLDSSFPLPVDRPFTTRQAHREGVPVKELTALTRLGLLRRPQRGVYVAAQVRDSGELRRQVLVLAAPPGSVVTDWSACHYWTGVDRPNADLEEPRLSVFRMSRGDRLRTALVDSGERSLLPSDVVELGGDLWVTTHARTALDLGRLAPAVSAIGGMDALARTGAFAVPELTAELPRFKGYRGVVQLRSLAPMVDGRAESPGESALRLRWLQTPGLPQPELQIPVVDDCGREVYRIDLGVEELLFGAEYDGEAWHDADAAAHDSARRQDLDERFGYTVQVFRRADVYGARADPGQVLQAALVAARTRLGVFRPGRVVA